MDKLKNKTLSYITKEAIKIHGKTKQLMCKLKCLLTERSKFFGYVLQLPRR